MDVQGVVLQEPRAPMGKEQKVALLFVIICGAGATILGVLYVWNHMASPFVISYEGPRLTVGDDAAAQEVARQKAADTDEDAISDYDEKNIYGTSPYLSDTDSDGMSDYAEITSGSDPSCKEGTPCDEGVADAEAFVPPSASGTFVGGITAPTAPLPPSGVGGDMGISSSTLTAADIEKLRNLPIAEVRKLLVSSGAEQEKVDALSDEDVRKLYEELLSSFSQ